MGYTDSLGNYHEWRSSLRISVNDFREATSGDVSNIVANGGILASDTTPTLTGNSTTAAQIITWAASNADQVVAQFALPGDFDGRDDVIFEAWVSSGTTDAASFTLLSNWDGGADVSDTLTDGAKSATMHKISCVIDRGDIPDSAALLSIALTPAAHTTNAIVLWGARLRFTARNLSGNTTGL